MENDWKTDNHTWHVNTIGRKTVCFSTDVHTARTKNVYFFHIIKMEISWLYRAFPVILWYLHHIVFTFFLFCFFQVQNKSVLLTCQSHVQASFPLCCRLFIVYLKKKKIATIQLEGTTRLSNWIVFPATRRAFSFFIFPRTSKVVSLFSTWLTCRVFFFFLFRPYHTRYIHYNTDRRTWLHMLSVTSVHTLRRSMPYDQSKDSCI